MHTKDTPHASYQTRMSDTERKRNGESKQIDRLVDIHAYSIIGGCEDTHAICRPLSGKLDVMLLHLTWAMQNGSSDLQYLGAHSGAEHTVLDRL